MLTKATYYALAAALGPRRATPLHCDSDLNTRSVFILAQAARPQLMRTRGSITAIASMSGLAGHPGYGAYSASKAAVVAEPGT